MDGESRHVESELSAIIAMTGALGCFAFVPAACEISLVFVNGSLHVHGRKKPAYSFVLNYIHCRQVIYSRWLA